VLVLPNGRPRTRNVGGSSIVTEMTDRLTDANTARHHNRDSGPIHPTGYGTGTACFRISGGAEGRERLPSIRHVGFQLLYMDDAANLLGMYVRMIRRRNKEGSVLGYVPLRGGTQLRASRRHR
jgi:hypothetical protein